MGIQQFRLPDVGEGLVEAEIVSWKVKPGDTVKLNDTVVEIETAKSLVELPVPYAGVVTELLVPEGETVPVGTPIIAVETAEATPRRSHPTGRWRHPEGRPGPVDPRRGGPPVPQSWSATAPEPQKPNAAPAKQPALRLLLRQHPQ